MHPTFVLVKIILLTKRDEFKRFCNDYWSFNKQTRCNSYLLPLLKMFYHNWANQWCLLQVCDVYIPMLTPLNKVQPYGCAFGRQLFFGLRFQIWRWWHLKVMAISIVGREMEWCEMTCDDQISNKCCKCMQIVVSI